MEVAPDHRLLGDWMTVLRHLQGAEKVKAADRARAVDGDQMETMPDQLAHPPADNRLLVVVDPRTTDLPDLVKASDHRRSEAWVIVVDHVGMIDQRDLVRDRRLQRETRQLHLGIPVWRREPLLLERQHHH